MNEQSNLLIVLGEWWERRRSQVRAAAPEAPSSGSRRWLRWLARQMLPNISTLLLVGILVVTANVWARPAASPAAAPGPSATTINYQGRLADSGGAPLDGTYGMSFSLWDAASDGNLVWGPENHAAVPVSEGLFSVGLGSQTSGGIPTNTWNGDRYLEITVGGETLSPRELIRSVPIAGMALTVPDGAITQEQASFAPVVYHKGDSGSLESVSEPIIHTGWFHGSDEGYATYDLSAIFSEIDAVVVTKTRAGEGNDKQVTFMVTDATGTGTPTPSEIKIWAYNRDGNLESWIQAYVVIIGR